MNDIDIAFLRGWVGRLTEAEDVVTQRLVDQYRATLMPHLAPTVEREVPLALHWILFTPSAPMSALSADGHPAKGGFLPPVPLPRRMWAGGELEIVGGFHVDDRVTRRSTIADITLKEGRTGPLCFVTVEHEYKTQRGIAIRERQDIVYRGETGAGGKTPVEAGAAPTIRPTDFSWTVDAQPAMLFRYSAITFNSHRIHYDQPYATDVEGYPGLVVHGPLQASLLLNLAASLKGVTPRRFSYRGVSPLIAGQTFDVCVARTDDGKVECWTCGREGQINMKASAEW